MMPLTAIAIVLTAAQAGIAPPPEDSSYREASYAAIGKLRLQEKREPRSARVKKALGVAYYTAGQHLLFRQKMAEAMALDAADPEPHYLLGRHYDSDVEDFTAAAGHLRAARAHPRAAAFLGHALEMSGNRTGAEAAYAEALGREPCDPVALSGMARLGKADEGKVRPCAAATARGDAMLLRTLAKLASDAGRPADAAADLERALAADPHNPALAYQLHRAWASAGDREKSERALAEYRRLRDIYGGGQ